MLAPDPLEALTAALLLPLLPVRQQLRRLVAAGGPWTCSSVPPRPPLSAWGTLQQQPPRPHRYPPPIRWPSYWRLRWPIAPSLGPGRAPAFG